MYEKQFKTNLLTLLPKLPTLLIFLYHYPNIGIHHLEKYLTRIDPVLVRIIILRRINTEFA